MLIKPHIQIIDLSLLVKDVLILADFHLGYEEALNKRGILMPRFQFKDTMERLKQIFAYIERHNNEIKSQKIKQSQKITINKIIINGDIKHEFGSISETEWRNILILIDYLRKHCKELIIIKGNHDMLLKPVADKRDIKLVDYYLIENKDTNGKDDLTIVLHGDKIPTKTGKGNNEMFDAFSKANTIIMGNEHPAISLKESKTSVRKEKFKCFLYGKYKSKEKNKKIQVKDLIVIPSFNLVTEGTDVLSEKILSPFLKLDKTDLSDFKVWVVADKVYYFGELKDLSF